MAVWDDILTDRDKAVFGATGYGAQAGLGASPAALVVDANYAFVGVDKPILESIREWPQSTGEEAWFAVRNITTFLRRTRDLHVPVLYTTNIAPGPLADRAKTRRKPTTGRRKLEPGQIVEEIAPQPDEVVIEKPKASGFFGTPLLSVLHGLSIDSLLIAGGTVSGCVRATAVDAAAHNFYVAVIEDCCFDRAQTSRKASLFDLQAKYADVMSLSQVLSYLSSLPRAPVAPSH